MPCFNQQPIVIYPSPVNAVIKKKNTEGNEFCFVLQYVFKKLCPKMSYENLQKQSVLEPYYCS